MSMRHEYGFDLKCVLSPNVVHLSDEANICKITNMPSHHHVAHPYSCSKFIACNAEDGTFVSAGYVYQHENGNVYNPVTGAADYPANVACSKSAGKIRYQLCRRI